MRIVAGEFSSRIIEAPKGNETRPTLDKVREAVFSSLGSYFDGGTFLDLYAGSGANGLEAISRGMDNAVLVDISRESIECIKRNIETLKVKEKCRVLKMKDFKALELLKEEGYIFDLVYLDPPYKKQHNDEVIKYLIDNKMLNNNSKIIIESDIEDEYLDSYKGFKKIKEAKYGQTKIIYYG